MRWSCQYREVTFAKTDQIASKESSKSINNIYLTQTFWHDIIRSYFLGVKVRNVKKLIMMLLYNIFFYSKYPLKLNH